MILKMFSIDSVLLKIKRETFFLCKSFSKFPLWEEFCYFYRLAFYLKYSHIWENL